MREECFCGWHGAIEEKVSVHLESDVGAVACPRCGRLDALTWLPSSHREALLQAVRDRFVVAEVAAAGNLGIVRALLETAFNARQPARAAAMYLSPGYRQHDSGIQGAKAFTGLVDGYLRSSPWLRLELQLLIGEGDWVVVQSLIRRSAEDPGRKVMDTFQLNGGQIVGHWDVMQDLTEKAALVETVTRGHARYGRPVSPAEPRAEAKVTSAKAL
jgi:predicted SnoaL-like aldol condensation-catalyzing enzyme